MRVISGSARGKKLTMLEGEEVRPTLDKVKGAIFNIIQFDIADSVTLDLFGGSGALAIEALSRGAKKAYIVDERKESIGVIEKNLADTRLKDKGTVFHGGYDKFIADYRGEPFDIVFLDPPYGKNLIDCAIMGLLGCQLINECGIIICESDKGDILKEKYGEFLLKKQYFYGKTTLSVYTKNNNG